MGIHFVSWGDKYQAGEVLGIILLGSEGHWWPHHPLDSVGGETDGG